MRSQLVIRFAQDAGREEAVIHRIRNFAEDLNRLLARESLGKVENMDIATSAVVVALGSKRFYSPALLLARHALRRHHLETGAVMERP